MRAAACFACLYYLLLPAPAVATEPAPGDTVKIYYLGEVVVTSRGEAVVQTASVSDITRAAAQRLDALQVAPALREVPGLYLRTNSRNEVLATIRGFDQRQIAVFIDGIPISLPYDGLIDLSQLPTTPVAKTTVTRGISSVLYGPNSMGGTINIVTGEGASELYGDIRLQGGDERAAAIAAGGSAGWLGWFASGQYRSSGNFPLPSTVPQELREEGSDAPTAAPEVLAGLQSSKDASETPHVSRFRSNTPTRQRTSPRTSIPPGPVTGGILTGAKPS